MPATRRRTSRCPRTPRFQRDGGVLDGRAAEAGDLTSMVRPSWMRDSLHQFVRLEPADRVRDAGDVHLQPVGRLGDRQRAAAAEPRQPQQLIAGKAPVIGPHAVSTRASRIWCARITDVTATMPSATSPQPDRSQLRAPTRSDHAHPVARPPFHTASTGDRLADSQCSAIGATAASTARVDCRPPTVIRSCHPRSCGPGTRCRRIPPATAGATAAGRRISRGYRCCTHPSTSAASQIESLGGDHLNTLRTWFSASYEAATATRLAIPMPNGGCMVHGRRARTEAQKP